MYARSSLVRGFRPSYAEAETDLWVVLQNHPSSSPLSRSQETKKPRNQEERGAEAPSSTSLRKELQFFRSRSALRVPFASQKHPPCLWTLIRPPRCGALIRRTSVAACSRTVVPTSIRRGSPVGAQSKHRIRIHSTTRIPPGLVPNEPSQRTIVRGTGPKEESKVGRYRIA